MLTKNAIIVLIALVSAPLLARVPSSAVPAQTRTSSNADTPTPGNTGQGAAKPANSDPEYVIGPADNLNVSVWKEPEVSASIPVRPDGKISLPLIDDVQAAGLTPMQLGKAITEKLKKYISDPQVTVVVTAVNSRRYYIIGQVGRPGSFDLLPDMTVLQAISASGGLGEFADGDKIYVLRNQNGKPARFRFNYKAVLRGDNPEQNITLKPGDTIVVP